MSSVVNEGSGHENQHDRTLRALAESKNWKQALIHVEKRLKKTKSDRLMVPWSAGLTIIIVKINLLS
jgi:hypothetical protein